MTKNGSTAHPHQQNTKRHTITNQAFSVSLRARLQEPGRSPWTHHVTQQSVHRRECSRAGLRALRRAFCSKRNCFRNVSGMPQLLFPDLFFCCCFFPTVGYTLYFTDFRELFEHQYGERKKKKRWRGNCQVHIVFTCQWHTDKEQRLSHVVSQAGLQRD